MPDTPSMLRLYLLRALYLLNFALLGKDVWPTTISDGGSMDPVRGVAFAFWCALSIVSALGLRCPVKMLPLLLMQFVYKAVWLLAIALPQWDAVRSVDLTGAMLFGIVVDLLVIPWPYLFRNYVKAPGDPWRPPAVA